MSLESQDLGMRVAAVQMVSGVNIDENLARARDLITTAVGRGAKLVALPEYFCLMGHEDRDKVAIREIEGQGPIQDWLSETAAELGIWLVGGTIPLVAHTLERVRNSTLVYNPQGKLAARYDKVHLFGFQRGQERYDESLTIEPGDTAVSFDGPCGRIGLSVCYDLRFPEQYRAMAPVDLLLVPAAFTYTTGQAHWEILLRARAIENQCYVLAPAQGGRHDNGRRTWGHSLLVDPWGRIVSVLDEGEGVVDGVIDLPLLKQIRVDLPALRHRVAFDTTTFGA